MPLRCCLQLLLALLFAWPIYSGEKTKKQKHLYLGREESKQIAPFIMPPAHPLFPILESIFTLQRVTFNADALAKAGFITKFIQPRSYIRVVSHPSMPGYLFKLYLDDDLRLKKFIPGWKWLVNRVKNARKIRKFIQKNNIRHFTVPRKSLYVLPEKPLPPMKRGKYAPKWEILVVEDMNLAPQEENLHAWKRKITKKHLDEFHSIIKAVGGNSYRATNVPLTKEGKFAFIDTEYNEKRVDTASIKPYLSRKMARYWKKLTKHDRAIDP
jgi:hypothetical protein